MAGIALGLTTVAAVPISMNLPENVNRTIGNLPQYLADNRDQFFTVLAFGAGVYYALKGVNYAKGKRKELPAKDIYKHQIWTKRMGESGKEYSKRMEELRDMINIRMTTSLPGANNANLQAISDGMVDKDGNINERLKSLGFDDRLLRAVDSFDGPDDSAIKDNLRLVDNKIEKGKKWNQKLKFTRRVATVLAVGWIAVNSTAPMVNNAISSVLSNQPQETISQEVEAPEIDNDSSDLDEQVEVDEEADSGESEDEAIEEESEDELEAIEEYNPNVTDLALNNADYEPGSSIGSVRFPDGREIYTVQGYPHDGDVNNSENNREGGFDDREMEKKNDGYYSNAVFYNNAKTDYLDEEMHPSFLPGNKGQTAVSAHTGGFFSGGEGGFNNIEKICSVGSLIDFEADNGTTFTYRVFEHMTIPIEDSGVFFNGPFVENSEASVLGFQGCFSATDSRKYDEKRREHVFLARGILVSTTDANGNIEVIDEESRTIGETIYSADAN